MKDDGTQFQLAVTSLIELLYETKQKLEEALAASRLLTNRQPEPEPSSPCHTCAQKPDCTVPCDAVEAQLPKLHQGRGHRENLTGLHPQTLSNNYERTRQSEIFSQYKKCQIIFSAKQWEVICLYYHEGLSESQIAKHLGKKPNTISDLLNRAKKRIETHRREHRKELCKLRYGQRRNST